MHSRQYESLSILWKQLFVFPKPRCSNFNTTPLLTVPWPPAVYGLELGKDQKLESSNCHDLGLNAQIPWDLGTRCQGHMAWEIAPKSGPISAKVWQKTDWAWNQTTSLVKLMLHYLCHYLCELQWSDAFPQNRGISKFRSVSALGDIECVLVKLSYLTTQMPLWQSHSHCPRFNCWDWSPFTGESSTELMGPPFDLILTPCLHRQVSLVPSILSIP